ncbi:MAG: hypothetical protein HY960_09630 [Ignavibacteriae bacterium]|nr:hypothetical protein [Ignavibacteriota bacterium]
MNIHKLPTNKDEITITLSKDQYKALLKTVFLGEWLVNSHAATDEEMEQDVEDIEQQVYSYAALAGQTKWIEFDESLLSFFPTFDMDTELRDFIDEYNIQNFWDMLIDNLATRDLLEQFGEEKINAMSKIEFSKKHFDLAKQYDDEFVEHNLDRLRIVKQ